MTNSTGTMCQLMFWFALSCTQVQQDGGHEIPNLDKFSEARHKIGDAKAAIKKTTESWMCKLKVTTLVAS